MINNIQFRFSFAYIVAILGWLPISSALADGTETLGPPSIATRTGSGVVAAGTGMINQPGMIAVDVPGAVQQVLLYWEGQMMGNNPGDNQIIVNGVAVSGVQIGGQSLFFRDVYSTAFRADISALGLVSPGANNLTINGMDFTNANNGAGVLVIFDDGSSAMDIEIRDGLDLAYFAFPAPRQTTIAQTFTFAAALTDRTADLKMFISSVSGSTSIGTFRPNAIEVSVGGATQVFDNLLDSIDGEEWDTVSLPISVPAGETMLTVQALSTDNLATGFEPASLAWMTAALSIDSPKLPSQGCTPGYWKQKHHFDSWVDYDPNDDYSTVFGVNASFSKTLVGALKQGGGKEKALGRHATAALLNTANGNVNFAFNTADVIAIVQDAYATGNFNAAKNRLAAENERGCPLN